MLTQIDTAADPFTQAYQAIWLALHNYAPFNALVKLGNQPDQSDPAFQQPKDTLAVGDTPYVELIQAAWEFVPFGHNSRAIEMTPSFPLITTVATLRVTDANKIKWAACRALHVAGGSLGLHSPGCSCKDWTIAGAVDRPDSGADGKGILRYSTVLVIRPVLYIPKATIQ